MMDFQNTSYDEHEDVSDLIYVAPEAPIESGKLKEWRDRRRTLKVRIHPLLNMAISWISCTDIYKNVNKKGVNVFSDEESILYTLHTPIFFLNSCQIRIFSLRMFL